MIPHTFGESGPFTVGIEEELFCLNAETLAPRPFPRDALDGARLKEELFASVVKLNTGVHRTVAEAVAELASLRARAKEAAGDAGLVLAAAGTWPTAVPEEQPVGESPAYRKFVDYAGPSARRQYVSGLHVHVGMESPEACMGALEAVLPWLPLVLALSANSPYIAGEVTGLCSARAETLVLLPRSAAPPVFAGYADRERIVERLVELGLADEITRVWWDVRPHPRFGTLEIRIADQPTRLETTGGVAALLQTMVSRLGQTGLPTVASSRRTAGPHSASGTRRSSSIPMARGLYRCPSSWASWPSASAHRSLTCPTRPESSSRLAARAGWSRCAVTSSSSRRIEAWRSRPTPSRSPAFAASAASCGSAPPSRASTASRRPTRT